MVNYYRTHYRVDIITVSPESSSPYYETHLTNGLFSTWPEDTKDSELRAGTERVSKDCEARPPMMTCRLQTCKFI